MKKVLMGIMCMIALFFICITSTAQQNTKPVKKYKLTCITTSCCGIGPFSIEIWKETTCYYVEVRKTAAGSEYDASIKITSDSKIEDGQKIEIGEDVILASEEGEGEDIEQIVLPKGQYEVNNNTIYFKTIKITVKKVCIVKEVKGELFGHEYHYTSEFCLYYPVVSVSKSSSGNVISMNPNLKQDELEKILQSEDRDFTILEDIKLESENGTYLIKSGKYHINDDGKIYLHNVKPIN